MARAVIFLVVAVFINAIYAQDGAVTATATNETDKNEAPESGICRKCLCKDGKVDCREQGLTSFFKIDDWEALKDFKPTQVDMGENSIENITQIADLPIEVLNLTQCGIETIEKASFMNLQELRVLDLSHNKLTSKLNPNVFEGRYSPEEYEPLEAMRTLILAHNDLHSLNQDLFEHLPELTSLDLSGNPLITIDYPTLIAMSSLPMLKDLRLRSCQLTEIPEKFLHTPRYLERLDISDNLLNAIPQELAETKNLVYLNINQNPIKRLDMSSDENPGFPRLPKLKELHMCNMQNLKSIGIGALAGLQNLEKLHMSFNPLLTEIHPKALARPDDIGETYDWPLVKELYLKSNNLQEVDSRLLSRWDLLTAVDVSDNPFMCDCSTQWMVDQLAPIVDRRQENGSKAMICQEPVEMRGYTMYELNKAHRTMRCVDKYGHRPERDGSILLGTLIGVLLALPIMLGIVLLWRRGTFRCLGFPGPSNSRAFYKRAPNADIY